MNRKKLSAIVVTVAFTFAILLTCCTALFHGINATFCQVSEKVLARAAEQCADVVDVRMENTVTNVTALAGYGFDNEGKSTEQQLAAMTSQVERYGYVRLGYAGLDGVAYTTDNYIIDICDREWYKSAIKGDTVISGMLEDKIGDGGEIVVIAVPVYAEGEVSGAFFCTQTAGKITGMAKIPSFGSKERSFIIDLDGNVAVKGEETDGQFNLFSEQKKSGLTKENLADCANFGTAGASTVTIKGQEYFVGFAALKKFPNEVLAVIAEKEHMMADANALARDVVIMMAVVGVVFVAIIMHNILYRKRHDKATTKVAFVDTLTDISNASLFYIEVQEKLNKMKGEKYALVYFDIDNFKMVNDIFGYDAGDQVLKAVAGRLMTEFSPGDNYARLFSDHFALFLKYSTQAELMRSLQSFFDGLAAVEIPVHGAVSLELSAGVYFVKDTLSDVHKIINNANIARGLVKGNKQKQLECFLENMRSDLTANSALEAEIKEGIAAREFDVFYQPKVSVATGEICGAEALLRWYHPKRGMLSPAAFIPIAEKNGLIVELGRWMFAHVCEDVERLVARGLDDISISFNLSKTEIYQCDVVEYIELTLEKHGLSGELFEVEITESHEVGNLDMLISLIKEFKRLGMRVSLDDFGTGYSSLSYLKSIPVDVLKLDKSFVDDITKSDADRDIVKEIISLAKILRLEVVSEGVETEAQRNFVSENGCDIIQGYYYHKPMSIEKLVELFKPLPAEKV